METVNKEEGKRYPPGAKMGILLCVLSALYLYLGLIVVPVLTIVGQVYFIYASRLWVKRYGGKRNFDMAHSLFHLGHPRWVTDLGITLFIAGFYLAPLIMLIQSFWQETNDVLHEVAWWMGNMLAVLYYIHIVWDRMKKSAS